MQLPVAYILFVYHFGYKTSSQTSFTEYGALIAKKKKLIGLQWQEHKFTKLCAMLTQQCLLYDTL